MLKQKRISCQNLVPYDFWHQIFAHPEIYRFFLRHGRKVGPQDLWNPWNLDVKNSRPSDPLGHQHLRPLGKLLLPFEIQNGNI